MLWWQKQTFIDLPNEFFQSLYEFKKNGQAYVCKFLW